jgi:hypothetical protein
MVPAGMAIRGPGAISIHGSGGSEPPAFGGYPAPVAAVTAALAHPTTYAHPRNARTKSCSTRNFSYRITPFRFCPNSANRSRSRPRRVT